METQARKDFELWALENRLGLSLRRATGAAYSDYEDMQTLLCWIAWKGGVYHVSRYTAKAYDDYLSKEETL